jgi:outer membrane protein assembly factor BamD
MLNHKLAILWGLCLVGVLGCGHDKYRHPSAERYYEAGNKALLKRKCWQAQQLFQNLLSDFPGSHLVDDAQYSLGQAYFCSKDYVTAIFEYERLINEFPTSPFVDEARYQIGICYYRQSRGIHHDQDDTWKAIREFRRFAEDFPNSERVSDAEERIQELRNKLAAKKLMVAKSYLKWENLPSVVRYCEIILNEFEDTDVVNRARFVLARTQHRMEAPDKAVEGLRLLLASDIPDDFRQEVEEEMEKALASIVKQQSVRPASTEAQEPEQGPVDGK